MYYGPTMTLGEMLTLWKCEPQFSKTCDCGGRRLIYYYTGSILTGTNVFAIKSICLQCDKSYEEDGSLSNRSAYFHVRQKYNLVEPIAERPVGIKDLVDFLQGRRKQIDDTEYDDTRKILK